MQISLISVHVMILRLEKGIDLKVRIPNWDTLISSDVCKDNLTPQTISYQALFKQTKKTK